MGDELSGPHAGGTVDIGLIGVGAVGSRVCDYLVEGRVPRARLTAALVRHDCPQLPPGVLRLSSLSELLATRPAIVVEAASHEALREHAPAIVEAGIDLLVVSTGALLDDDLRRRLEAAAAGRGSRVRLVSGAIGAIDALRAAAVDGLERVEVEQRKPARSLLGREEAAALTAPRTVYEGSVVDAVRAFPETTNILATVALAGIGGDRTRVRIVADPAATSNRARLTAEGRFGSFQFEIDNRASENPRTSVLTALSVVSALQAMVGSLAIA